ncbi:MAG: tat (twin-arginine translocation) pathway signal sequence, partial [Pseudomonas sp.]
VYAFPVKALDQKASSDPGAADVLKQGIATLDQKAGGDWRKIDATQQVAILQSIQDTPFFAMVRATAVNTLYSNELAYLHFCYEGASFPKGGYLMRGFNDLSWLPNPPAAASPNPFT